MKKWFVWLILSGVWLVAALLNALEQRNVWYSMIVAVIFAALSVAQYFCDEKGKISKKSMNLICAAVLAFAILTVIIVIF